MPMVMNTADITKPVALMVADSIDGQEVQFTQESFDRGCERGRDDGRERVAMNIKDTIVQTARMVGASFVGPTVTSIGESFVKTCERATAK